MKIKVFVLVIFIFLLIILTACVTGKSNKSESEEETVMESNTNTPVSDIKDAGLYGDEQNDSAKTTAVVSVKESLKEVGFYTDWQLAGIPGGIPNATVVQGDPISPGENVADVINSRIQAAGDAVRDSGGASPANLRVVQLTEGIFELGDTTISLNRAGVILRGMEEKTVLRGTTNNDCINIGESKYYSLSVPVIDVTADANVGDDRITVADGSIFEVGQILRLDRFADDAPAADGGTEWDNGHNQFMRGTNTEFGPIASPSGTRPISQYIEISSISGNTLVLANRINIAFHLKGASGKDLYPQVWDTGAQDYKYIGLEDMKLQMTNGDGNLSEWSWHLPAVHFRVDSSYSWMKNVESDGTYFDENGWGFMGRHIEVNGFRNQVTGNYVHHSSQINPGGNGYGIRFHGTDCVIDNNICDFLNKPLLGQTSGGGNVIAYNYVPNAVIGPWNGGNYADGATPDKPQTVSNWVETAIDPSHGGISHSDLYEGNYTSNIHTDGTSGNGLIVLFRNFSRGGNMGGNGPDGALYNMSRFTVGSLYGLHIAGGQFQHASIGNVYLDSKTGPGADVWSTKDNGTTVYSYGSAVLAILIHANLPATDSIGLTTTITGTTT
ncbi:MAG: hypothetical protein FWD71_04960 [Oscillospiraceae bacterium]|nr:hypothetical protein [Oscillospiraceae bacterium]